MFSWSDSAVYGASVTPTGRDIQPGQTLISSSSCYSIVEFIGEGCFGRVAKCKNLSTDEIVALKIKKDIAYVQDKEKEVFMLNVIGILNSDHTNIVTFFERFEYMGQICLAFEMLDGHLYQLLEQRGWKPMAINEIRPIAKQLLGALDALKGLGVMHTDIKPDNIMLVNRHDQPLRVKLIDFGAALLASDVQLGMDIQPLGYRAPEVALGLPFTEAVDVWGVGCVLAYLYLTDNLFPVDCEYQIMKSMVEVLGLPEGHQLRAGLFSECYFKLEKAGDSRKWRLMTPEEYTAANNMKPVEQRNSLIELPSSLDALVHIYPKGEAAELEDRREFVHLMKGLLHIDGDRRICPRQAMQQSFITMAHLIEHLDSTDYLTRSRTFMSGCQREDSIDWVPSPTKSTAGLAVGEPPSVSSSQATMLFHAGSHEDTTNTGSDSTAAAIASSSRSRKMLRRAQRLLNRITATCNSCCKTRVEE
ncbi:homeodomain-interacting protein kinase 1-like isoform X1 [Scophthalmus maximus]|uniref:homeodomain-interacting protein kinase 1-like isoform X1 n=1 Tax=Scophthalmus maximus TaxID=52904 RepID=UPI0015E06C3D|nr:homeodomain-interacting protein kinase 1-like isoform X1 [Scophthalmus maximus]